MVSLLFYIIFLRVLISIPDDKSDLPEVEEDEEDDEAELGTSPYHFP